MKRLLMTMIMLLMLNRVEAQPSARYGYVYANNEPAGNISLHVIEAETHETEEIVVPTLEGELVVYARTSPDGQWILTQIAEARRGSFTLRLYAPNTGEVRDFLDLASFGVLRWSPDSQHIAVIATDMSADSNQIPALYVYDIVNASLEYLTGGAQGISNRQIVYDVAWSDDSRRLLSASSICTVDDECRSTFEAFEMPTRILLQNIDFTSWGDIGCNFLWSPDESALAFTFSCGSGIGLGISEYVRDVYVWRINDNVVSAATENTQVLTPVGLDNTTTYSYRYDYAWYGADMLVITVMGGRFTAGSIGYHDEDFHHETIMYRMDNTQVPLDDQTRFELALTQMYGLEFMYRHDELALYTDDYNMRQVQVTASQFEVGTITEQDFDVLYSGVAGGGAEWSPDGALLVYGNRGFPFVVGGDNLQGFVFVRRDRWAASRFELAEPYAYGVGWLRE